MTTTSPERDQAVVLSSAEGAGSETGLNRRTSGLAAEAPGRVSGKRPAVESFRVSVLRPDDLVSFDVECVEMDRIVDESTGRTVLVPRPGRDSMLVLHLGPQHVGERAFYEVRGDHPTGPRERVDAPKAPAPADTSKPSPPPADEPLTDPPVASRFAEPSRVVFAVPADHPAIEYSVRGLLDAFRHLGLRIAWSAGTATEEEERREHVSLIERLVERFGTLAAEARTAGSLEPTVVQEASHALAALAMMLGGVATTPIELGTSGEVFAEHLAERSRIALPPRLPSEPGRYETAIEAPFRLVISPNEHAQWRHEIEPVRSSDPSVHRVELWHTALDDRRSDHRPTLRAIWNRQRLNPDKTTRTYAHEDIPFRMSLDDAARSMLVDLTANYGLVRERGRYRYIPTPFEARNLLLSSLGASLDLRGAWDSRPDGVSLAEWVHRAPMGRDQYVEVIYESYLFPLTHKATVVKITERRIDRSKGRPIAYLFQHTYLAVSTPEVHYRGHHDMPFTSIRLTTLVTPDILDPATTSVDPKGLGGQAFWPTLDTGTTTGTKFAFHCVATDLRGKLVHFDTPLVVIDEALFTTPGADAGAVVRAAGEAFEKWFGGDDKPSDPPLHGQQVTLAPTDRPGDTTFALSSLGFTGGLEAADAPPFRPWMRRAAAVIPSVQNLTGRPDPVPVRFHATYVGDGFGTSNPGEAFLERIPELPAVKVDFAGAADRAGGLVRPDFSIAAISRARGPVGGLVEAAATGGFDPKAFFEGGGGPLLFGVFQLADVVSGVAPTFVAEALTAFAAFKQDAARLDGLAQQAAAAAKTAGVDSSALSAFDTALGTVSSSLTKVQAALDKAASDPTTAAGEFASAVKGASSALETLRTDLADLRGPRALAEEVLGRIAAIERLLSGPLAAGIAAGGTLADSLRRIRLEWSPRLTSFPNDPGMWIFGADPQTKLTLAVELRRNADPKGKEAPPGVDISCAIEHFRVRLVPPLSMVVLHFERVAFSSHDGKKPDVDVRFAPDGIEFVGILTFVQTLRSLIPLDGFSDPPSLEVGADGVRAGFSLGLPNLAIGVFSLENVGLGADFKVPFIVDPVSVGFNFCTRERPFTLTVSMLGGGGFFGIRVSPKGVMLLEAALEFGASVSVDLGVASGSVTIMAGIYFKMEFDACSLAGYLRLRGEVDVLGLISASIELYLGLAYESSSKKMVGRATITVEVEVICFSTTAHITCEKTFAGASGDPTLAELLDPVGSGGPGSPWFEYCEAFASG